MVNFALRAARACRKASHGDRAHKEHSHGMTRQTHQMFAARGTISLALLAMLQAVTSVACVEVNGGAAELSWSVRTFDGARVEEDCHTDADSDEPKVHLEGIRLAWKAVADGEDGASMEPDDWKQFPCADGRGITEFSIPPGQQMFWIVPVCDGAILPAAGSFQVPPPIVRTVREGTVTTLDALLVVADESTCPAP